MPQPITPPLYSPINNVVKLDNYFLNNDNYVWIGIEISDLKKVNIFVNMSL